MTMRLDELTDAPRTYDLDADLMHEETIAGGLLRVFYTALEGRVRCRWRAGGKGRNFTGVVREVANRAAALEFIEPFRTGVLDASAREIKHLNEFLRERALWQDFDEWEACVYPEVYAHLHTAVSDIKESANETE